MAVRVVPRLPSTLTFTSTVAAVPVATEPTVHVTTAGEPAVVQPAGADTTTACAGRFTATDTAVLPPGPWLATVVRKVVCDFVFTIAGVAAIVTPRSLGRSTVNDRDAGVGSALPAGSVARTWNW